MSTEPRTRCTATTEFGRCGYEAGGHTRHRAKTEFGEMEWDEPAAAPAGTGSPARAELARVEGVRDDFRHELFIVWRALVQAVGGDAPDDQQPPALELVRRLAAELSQVQRERDGLRAEVRSHRAAQVALMAALDVEGKPEEVADVAIRDRSHLRQTFDRVATERDEARSALAALRAEVGKIADALDGHLARMAEPDDGVTCVAAIDARDALRALVTDQSPRECSTCNGAAVVKCEAHVAGDGCEDLVLRCPDCVTDQSPTAPRPDVDHRAQYWALRALVAVMEEPRSPGRDEREARARLRARKVIAATDAAYVDHAEAKP